MKTDNKVSARLIVVWLDTREAMKNGKHPFRVRITIKKARYYFKTPLEATEELYKRAMYGERKTTEEKELFFQLGVVKTFAENVFDSLPEFTPEAFRRAFYKESTSTNERDVFSTFRDVIGELENGGFIGNANIYKTTMRSIAAFCNGKLLEHSKSNKSGKKQADIKPPKLRFEEITLQWLKRYETALTAVKVSPSTQGIYLRALRRIVNIERKQNPSLPYPFGKDGFTPPTATKNKRALTITEVRSIRNYYTLSELEQRAKDLWTFSYLCNGMNIADIIKLSYKEIKFHSNGCSIEFSRQKTQQKKDKTKILIELDTEPTELIKLIIERHGNDSKDSYVFPFMNGKETPQDQFTAKLSLLRQLNKALHKIGTKLNLQIDLTTYVARHSYATVMQRSGVSIAEISEALGHAELKTTENYLGGFSDESKRINSNKLL
ncbi:MAG: site-specific integrase [Ignavibacteria bacterium]|nr:site-specific integrase [Ignavibacteria bacterium]